MPVVRISDELFARLQQHAEPLVDSVSDVICKLVDHFESREETKSSMDITPQEDLSSEEVDTEVKNYPNLWLHVAEAYNSLSPIYPCKSGGTKVTFRQIPTARRDTHYEWNLRRKTSHLDVCLHFESKDRDQNVRRMLGVTKIADVITAGIDADFTSGPWGENWAEAKFRIKYEGVWPNQNIMEQSARIMKLLVDRTWEIAKAP